MAKVKLKYTAADPALGKGAGTADIGATFTVAYEDSLPSPWQRKQWVTP